MPDYSQIISHAEEFVQRTFTEDYSGHDPHHTFRVRALALRIAGQEGACLPIVELAALLHDVDDHKLSPETSENCLRAAEFLRREGVPADHIDRIVHIIQQISFSRNTLPPDSVEAQCVQDADRLDAIGAIGIGRAFAFGGSRGRAMYDPDGVDSTTSIAHFYDKLLLLKARMNTETGRRIAESRDHFLRSFLDEFLAEWNGDR